MLWFQSQKSSKRLNLQSHSKSSNLVRRRKVPLKARGKGQQLLMAKVSLLFYFRIYLVYFIGGLFFYSMCISVSYRKGERCYKVEATQHSWAFCRTAALLQGNYRGLCWLLWSKESCKFAHFCSLFFKYNNSATFFMFWFNKKSWVHDFVTKRIYSVVLLNLVCHPTSLLSSCLFQEALQSIATDPGLYQMLPRFSTFISEGVSIFWCCFYLKHHFPCFKKKRVLT